jgi:hypothetical protein
LTAEELKRLYGTGRAYRDAAALVDSNLQSAGRDYLLPPTHNLLGLSIELLYKAVLRKRRVSAKELRKRELGHDLLALRTRAKTEGFVSGVDGLDEIIDHIGCDYRLNNYRYLPDGKINKVNMPAAVAVLDRFIDEVASEVGLPLRPEASS